MNLYKSTNIRLQDTTSLLMIIRFFLWKKKPLGYVVGAGLFIAYGILSFGLIAFLAIQSHLRNTSIDLLAIVILIVMAVISLIPFLFFVRGANKMSNLKKK